MKYLRKFENANEEFAFRMSDEYMQPNVCLVDGEIKYNIPALAQGVYIQHTNGMLYTRAEWSAAGFTAAEANGVAIIDSRASFVVAPKSIGLKAWSSKSTSLVPGLPSLTKAQAATDYAGYENTQLMLADGDSSGAAYVCANYIFKNGKKGYLPSYGETQVYLDYSNDANAAFYLIGGSTFIGSNTWTSSQAGSSTAWFVWSSGSSTKDKASTNTVWPVTQL